MGNEDTLSKDEIIRLIEEGDRYAGIKFEKIEADFTMIAEIYEILDAKVDKLDTKLEEFRGEVNFKFDLLFESQQNFFQELKAIREEFSERFNRLDDSINNLPKVS